MAVGRPIRFDHLKFTTNQGYFRFNEERELLKRHVNFNLRSLIGVAVESCNGARYCTKVVKCLEGLRNKAFLLTMDNNVEVFAKIPNPNAGPRHYTTASEVATLILGF
ncbi:hypothetical protein BJX64DRAFT_268476 [Aspergillus heterothallicus]